MGYIGSGPTRFNTADELTVTGDAEFNGNLTVKGTTTTIDSASVQTVDLGDNDKIRLGDGDDLQIYHDGSHSYVQDAGQGRLYVRASDGIKFDNTDSSKTGLSVFPDSAVYAHYNGSLKLATTATGVDVTGVITTDGLTTSADITFGDNDKAIFGANKLDIHHDGADNLIRDLGTGDNYIQTNNSWRFTDVGNNETHMIINDNGAIHLYYDNATKLSTTATGVDVTGTVTADGLDLGATTGVKLTLYPTNYSIGVESNELRIASNAVTSFYSGGHSGTERMRLTADGSLLVGTTSSSTPFDGCKIAIDANSSDGIRLRSSGVPMRFIATGTSTFVGSISTTASATSYNTSSDYRLKTAVTYDWDATTRLKQLRPARFEWIVDGDDAVPVDGFLAHEVQDVVPEAITGTHNEVDDEGNPVYQGIDQSKLVPLLVKTIQELEARIVALETA
jgi:hypothetical protein